MTTSIYTRPRLKQPLHCASQSSHDARCMSKQPQLAGNNASCHSHTQDQLKSSQAAMQRLAANIYSVAGRMQPVFSCANAARETARTTTSICTRPRLKQSPHCASQPLHDATGSKQCKLPYQRSTINSEPVRWRCGDSQLTPPQSQVGRSRVSRALAARETVQRDNIHLHMTQTEAITALRVSTAARRTMHEKAATNGS